MLNPGGGNNLGLIIALVVLSIVLIITVALLCRYSASCRNIRNYNTDELLYTAIWRAGGPCGPFGPCQAYKTCVECIVAVICGGRGAR